MEIIEAELELEEARSSRRAQDYDFYFKVLLTVTVNLFVVLPLVIGVWKRPVEQAVSNANQSSLIILGYLAGGGTATVAGMVSGSDKRKVQQNLPNVKEINNISED